jgi:GNAT superfamily N-acetyltransferase
MSQAYLDGLAVADRAAAWRQRLSDPAASPVLVGTMRGRVAGFASFGPTRDADSGGAGELYALNVHPAHWGTGVGSALLRATENALATMGFADAVLWVVPGNVRARRFYERHGWTDAGARRTAEIHGVTVPEVRYAKVLP